MGSLGHLRPAYRSVPGQHLSLPTSRTVTRTTVVTSVQTATSSRIPVVGLLVHEARVDWDEMDERS